MPLHLDYRPESFKEFYGNESVIKSLKAILKRDDLPHAWLFEGPFGCGKTTLAYILSKELNCDLKSTDFKEINCGSHGKIDTVREIEKQAMYRPAESKHKVFLLDEAQALGTGGNSERNMPQRALLKILEQAPDHVHIILCTTNSGMLLDAIRSRCTTFKLEKLSDKKMKALIASVLREEEVGDFTTDALEALLEAADGHPRDALRILDQVIDLEPDSVIDAISGFKSFESSVYDLFWALFKRNSWVSISGMLKDIEKQAPNAEEVRRHINNLAKKMILKEKGGEKTDRYMDIFEVFRKPVYDNGFTEIVFNCYEVTA